MYSKYTLFYEFPKNWEYYVHPKTVCTRPLLGGGCGGVGPGDEVIGTPALVILPRTKAQTLLLSGSQDSNCLWAGYIGHTKLISCFVSYKLLFSLKTKVERKWCTNSKMHCGG